MNINTKKTFAIKDCIKFLLILVCVVCCLVLILLDCNKVEATEVNMSSKATTVSAKATFYWSRGGRTSYVTMELKANYLAKESMLPTFTLSGFINIGGAGSGQAASIKEVIVTFNNKTYGKNVAISLNDVSTGEYTVSAKITVAFSEYSLSGSVMDYVTQTVSCKVNIVNKLNVTFDLNGGERTAGGELTQVLEYGQSATAPIVSRTGWTFAGWDKSFDYITDDIVVTAKWVDDIAPTGSIITIDNETVTIPFVSKAFKYVASDLGTGIKNVQYRVPNSQVWQNYTNGQIIALPTEGIYYFRCYDNENNISVETTIEYIMVGLNLSNAPTINSSYKLTSWYNVTLPERVFGATENYSLANYNIALQYAMYREQKQRVTEIAEGWIYVSVANENVAQIYTDGATLENAIRQYAKRYVSEEQKYKTSGNKYYTPLNENFEVDDKALATEQPALPSFLAKYNGLELYLCRQDYAFVFTTYKDKTITSGITVQYIANDYIEQSSSVKNIAKNSTLSNVYGASLAQGYYLIRESTTMNVTVEYIVYIDKAKPSLTIEVQQGNGEYEELELNEDYIDIYGQALRYFDLRAILMQDNIDKYVTVQLSGRGIIGAIYTNIEDIPVLCYDNGYYGTYTFSIYDRSGNVLQFNVVIAGKLPTLTHTSLTNETKLTLTIAINDSTNALTEIHIYKVSSSGDMQELLTDDDGTPIDVNTLTYVLRNGGKYTVIVTDLYGRTVTLATFFYEKGIPSGQLVGVTNGGTTNKDVTLIYLNEYQVELYKLIDGEWQNADISYITEDGTKKRATLTVEQGMLGEYKFFLYNSSNRDLFVEYTFKVKCVLPTVTILSGEDEILQGTVITGESFCVTWNDSYLEVWYWRLSGLGELGKAKYKNGTLVLTQDTYHFVVSDEVGNKIEFDVKLDNSVSYKIDGNYTLIDGVYCSKYNLTLTATEVVAKFECVNTNNLVINSGDRIDKDGTYTYTIVDAYGNSVTLVFKIDKTPPKVTIVLDGGGVLDINSATNKPFSILTDEKATITWKLNSGSSYTYNDEKFSEEGVYSFVAKDQLGNSISFKVTITFEVTYNIKGSVYVEGDTYYSNDYLLLSVSDATLHTVSSNGVTVENNKKVADEGTYTITITTSVGNVKTITFVIDKTAPTLTVLDAKETEVENGTVTKYAIRATWSEEDVSVEYKFNTSSLKTYTGDWLTESGDYTFIITDKLGNKATFTVSIKTSIDYTIDGTYTQLGLYNYISNNYIIVNLTEKAEIAVETESSNGVEIKLGEKIQIEGTYSIKLTDSAGNVAYIYIIIDKTAPSIEANVVNKESTKENVTVSIEENTVIECLFNGSAISIGNIDILTEHGKYVITVNDIAGNVATIEFQIDKQVEVEIDGVVVDNQITTNEVSFVFSESIQTVATLNGSVFEYKGGIVKDIGKYSFVFTDNLGNTKSISFEIMTPTAKEHSVAVPEGYNVTVLFNGQQVSIDANNGYIELKEQGTYHLTFDNGAEIFELELSIKNTPPTVTVVKDGDYVRIEDTSGEKITYTLTRDGVQISYKFGDTLTTNGNYVLVVTDAYGNIATYNFTIQYVNVFGQIVIGIGVALALALVVYLIISRKRKIK